MQNKKNKSQVSMEFILTTGLVLMLFMAIMLISVSRQKEIRDYQYEQNLKIPCLKISNLISDIYNTGNTTKIITSVDYNFTILGQSRQIVVWEQKNGINRSYFCEYLPLNVTNNYNTSFTIKKNTEFIVENYNNQIEIRPAWMDNDLVLWLPMDRSNSSHVIDRSGNEINGGINGADCTADGYRGKGCDFDGSNDYIEFSDIDIDKNITISLLCKRNNYNNAGLFLKWNSGDNSFALLISSNKTRWRIANSSDTSGGGNFDSDIPIDKWTSIICKYNGIEMNCFVNGTKEATSYYFSGDLRDISTPMRIGYLLGTGYFNGTIDDVRIYNRTLTDDEISELYNFYDNYITKTNGDFLK